LPETPKRVATKRKEVTSRNQVDLDAIINGEHEPANCGIPERNKIDPRCEAVITEGVYSCAGMQGIRQLEGLRRTQAGLAGSHTVGEKLFSLLSDP
jgi:GTP cyclohydrolase I